MEYRVPVGASRPLDLAAVILSMGFRATPYTVTTALMVAFALLVIYVRMKNWLDSNVPLYFYVILIVYMRAVDGTVPVWLIVAGFALTMLLRFEFLNPFFTKSVKFLEICALGGMIYLGMRMVLQV
ncbi:MAG TPA: hypothetical protein VMH05_00795 [Bryobacteraceae bacterium]|nr:hypothetical protein [Bryobacteraceae bacterium]